MDEAVRGHIYRFEDGKTDKIKYALVISSNRRKSHKLVSILMLGDSKLGLDTVKMPDFPEFTSSMYAHCGLVTYVPRGYLVEHIGCIDDEVMRSVEQTICNELELNVDLISKAHTYELLYDELLDRLVERK